jgi:hypothetical protein
MNKEQILEEMTEVDNSGKTLREKVEAYNDLRLRLGQENFTTAMQWPEKKPMTWLQGYEIEAITIGLELRKPTSASGLGTRATQKDYE